MADFADPTRPLMTPIVPAFKMPNYANLIRPNPLMEYAASNCASESHERLVAWITGFDHSLDQEHEIGLRLVSFGQSVVFRLEDMGYWNPSLISFKGKTEDGQPVELIQHVSQISVLLTRLPRLDPSQPKRPIGFGDTSSGVA